MIRLGEYALWIALPVALWGTILAALGAGWGREAFLRSAERSVHAVFFLSALALAGLGVAFWTDAFPYRYVSDHSNREMEPLYKLTGVWAGDRGLLLLRTVGLAFVASGVVRGMGVGRGGVRGAVLGPDRDRSARGWGMAVLLALLAGFLLLHLFALSPFDRLAFNPSDGRGPDPAFRDGWMALHTGAVHLGATLFAVPFALAVAVLVSGGAGDGRGAPAHPFGSLEAVRRWVLAGWLLVGAGILAGMRRAYGDPASGGFWGWDPVEVALLVIWLVATALLHTFRIEARTGSLRRWNLALVLLLFPLALVAPVMAGSGLLESAHPLRFGTAALRGVVGVGVVLGVGAVLLFTLRGAGGGGVAGGRGTASHSRDSVLLAGAILLLVVAAIAAWGSLAPLLTGGGGEGVTVGPPFFQRFLLPLGVVLLAGMGISPLVGRGRMSVPALARALPVPAGVGIAGAGVLLGVGVRDGWTVGVVGLFGFTLAALLVAGWKEVRERMDATAASPIRAVLVELRHRSRAWGARLVHLGLALLVLGVALQDRGVEVRGTLDPGDSMEIVSPMGSIWTFHYLGMSTHSGAAMWQLLATFRVERDGRTLGFVDTERRMHAIPPRTTSRWGLHAGILEDVRVLMEAMDDDVGMGNDPDFQRADFRFEVRPFMAGVGYGGILLLLGGLLAFRPEEPTEIPPRGAS